MGYKFRPTLNIDLSDLGEDANGLPFFVEIKHPKLLTYEEKMNFALVAKDVIDENKKIIMTKETIGTLEDVAKSYVVNWNLLDKVTGIPILPTQEDALKHVPGVVVERIQNAINGKEDEETKNSLAQLDKSSEGDQLQGV